ncbi:MAG: hypothetical protein AB7U34_01055 [Novosphingobium sp.]
MIFSSILIDYVYRHSWSGGVLSFTLCRVHLVSQEIPHHNIRRLYAFSCPLLKPECFPVKSNLAVPYQVDKVFAVNRIDTFPTR